MSAYGYAQRASPTKRAATARPKKETTALVPEDPAAGRVLTIGRAAALAEAVLPGA